MSAPLIRPISTVVTSQRAALPTLPGAVRAYVVVGEGCYLGSTFATGDVLVCRGDARSGRATVLEARHGRPRLGTLLGDRLVGDAGEQCHPSRWRAAGHLVAVYRRTTAGWVVELLDQDGTAAAPVLEQPTPVVLQSSAAVQQLSLFAA